MLFLYNPCMLCQITASISIKQKPQSTHPMPGTRAGSRMRENSWLKVTQSQEQEKARKHGGELGGGGGAKGRGSGMRWLLQGGKQTDLPGSWPKGCEFEWTPRDDRGQWSLMSHRPLGHKELDLTQQVGNNRQGPLEEPMQNLCQRRLHSGQSPRISLPLPHSDSAPGLSVLSALCIPKLTLDHPLLCKHSKHWWYTSDSKKYSSLKCIIVYFGHCYMP